MINKKLNLGALALNKSRELEVLIEFLNNTTTANLLSDIEYIQNIDNAIVQENPKSLPLIFLLKSINDDISYLKSIDFNTLFSFASNIDAYIAIEEASKNSSQQSADTALQAKNDTVRAINNANLYNPTKQERRYKAEFFGIKLL